MSKKTTNQVHAVVFALILCGATVERAMGGETNLSYGSARLPVGTAIYLEVKRSALRPKSRPIEDRWTKVEIWFENATAVCGKIGESFTQESKYYSSTVDHTDTYTGEPTVQCIVRTSHGVPKVYARVCGDYNPPRSVAKDAATIWVAPDWWKSRVNETYMLECERQELYIGRGAASTTQDMSVRITYPDSIRIKKGESHELMHITSAGNTDVELSCAGRACADLTVEGVSKTMDQIVRIQASGSRAVRIKHTGDTVGSAGTTEVVVSAAVKIK